jgi:hypothetical protein
MWATLSCSYVNASTPSGRLPVPNYSTSSCSPTSSEPTGSGSYGAPGDQGFGELLIDLEEDKVAPAVVFGLLAEMERK